MPATIRRFLVAYLNCFTLEWIHSQPGFLTQSTRKEALALARKNLVRVHSNSENCLQKLEDLAVDVKNYRGNMGYHLQFKLRMFAIIQWLTDHSDEAMPNTIEEIAQRTHCPEITSILAGEPIT